MKLNGQSHISFQLLSPENSKFLLHGKASHTKAMEKSCVHHESLRAKKILNEGTVSVGFP